LSQYVGKLSNNKLLWEGEKIPRFDGSTASFEALHNLGKNQLKKETSKFWLVVVKEGDSVFGLEIC
jgi:hypothetical protein